MKILTFDVGGTKISYALASEKGRLLSAVTTLPTPQDSAAIAQIFATVAAENKADALAIATAGVVFRNKVLGKPNNLPLGYDKINFAKVTGLPCLIENDANAAAWAEHKIGALKNMAHAVMLTLGTGVGCGIICNNRLLYGKTGAAGEVTFPLAGCDLAKFAEQNGIYENDCFRIYEMVKQHQSAALKAYEEWQREMIDALVCINRLLDVEAVAFSGSLARIVNYAHVEAAVNQRAYRNPLKVVPAECGSSAGLVGAALLYGEKNRD